jgi:hypothetical protein
MREFIEAQYHARFVQFGEPDDEGGTVFSAYCGGRFIVAPSLALMLSALQERTQHPLVLVSLPMAA